MSNPLHTFATDNADVNLAAGATIFSESNADSVPRLVILDIKIGDGTDDLLADSETTLTFQVSNGGVLGSELAAIVPDAQDRYRVQTEPLLWVNGETLALTCISSNSSDVDVDCTVAAIDVAALQPIVSSRSLGVEADGTLSADYATAADVDAVGDLVSNVPGEVWEELEADHDTAATFGKVLADGASSIVSLALKYTGITSVANWWRRIVRKDAGTADMLVALGEINASGGDFTAEEALEALSAAIAAGGGQSESQIEGSGTEGVDFVATYYGTVAEAHAYFQVRLHETAWTDASVEDRPKALWAATQIIDTLNFKGDKHAVFVLSEDATDEQIREANDSQVLEFPRGSDTEIPQAIRVACYEIAHSLLDGKDPEQELEALGISSAGYSSVRTTYNRSQVPIEHIINGVPNATAWRLIRPFLRDGDAIKLSRV